MKIRSGFVSNSSSSSFICEFCGESSGGYNLDLIDCEMVNCEVGHCFCIKHILDKSEYELDGVKFTKGEILDYDFAHKEYKTSSGEEFYGSEFIYEFPKEYCPICNLTKITSELMLKHLFIKYNLNKDEVTNEIKKLYSNASEIYKKYQDLVK